jgi:three-Cys-motif partner protein
MEIPPEYHDREQSYLKHRVLREYLELWGRKIGSLARHGPVTLWYVDCFAGPWQSQNEELGDTSIHIGLSALEEAGRIWRENGQDVKLRAIFVEKDDRAFARLKQYLDNREGMVETTAFHGAFGSHVAQIARLLGNDPAFVFVDPTGFKGVAMDYIRPLLAKRMREVLVNVMFNHINRFKDDSRAFLREQMKAFFGLSEDALEKGLSEAELLRTYRTNLKSNCDLTFAADLAVPHPTKRRTWFRLVIGGKHPEVLKVFREVEARVIGGEAASIRTGARDRKTERQTGQLSLLSEQAAPAQDPWYEDENKADRLACIDDLITALPDRGRRRYRELWPSVLEERHVTESELAHAVVRAARTGRLRIEPVKRGRRRAHDDDLLSRLDLGA